MIFGFYYNNFYKGILFKFVLMVIRLDAMEVVRYAKDWIDKSEGKRFVKIIPEEDFDVSQNQHPLEKCLYDVGIGTYYFEGDEVGRKDDYEINLRKMKLNYSIQQS